MPYTLRLATAPVTPGERPGGYTGATDGARRDLVVIAKPIPTEVKMSITEQQGSTETQVPATAQVDLKLEVVVVPVTDVDRAKDFYDGIGWRLDADIVVDESYRVVHLTPPGSQASVAFGTGISSAKPGTGSVLLAVDNVDAARADLIGRGVDVSEVFHGKGYNAGTDGRVPGPDPERGSYKSWASFRDPDGNEWLLQEVTSRLPGRVDSAPVEKLGELLLETAQHHDRFEKATPEHNWWDWYAPYLSAREQGRTSEQATAEADAHMKEVHGVVAR
jgi:catechol 2,3-dioxygenase-like lactoylglutathione lyase family enzyme